MSQISIKSEYQSAQTHAAGGGGLVEIRTCRVALRPAGRVPVPCWRGARPLSRSLVNDLTMSIEYIISKIYVLEK